ncbi:hypothetical protein EIP86_004700 [Pleurotus ostreatoroseus]|nr:hypothetical protein EIP86_004700 [Pleurotus ostreatoroseus]
MTASSTATRTTQRKSVSPSRESLHYVCSFCTLTRRESIPLEQTQASTNGVVAQLEAQVSTDDAKPTEEQEPSKTPEEIKPDESNKAEEEEEEEQEEEEAEEEEEDTPQQSAPTLTTEYTPRDRNAPLKATPQPTASTSATAPGAPEQKAEDDIDTTKLPVVHAPPSHPAIDPNVVGTLDGRSILEVDLSALADKPWRRPGSDVSDWFNYGFDEISWEAYCYRRQEMGEGAAMLKTNVLNFAGMPEEQMAALPSEIRQMVMAGASAMMNSGNAGPGPGGMMPAGMNMNGGMMNPMMDMGQMMPMMHDMDVSMAMASQGMQGMGMPMGPGMGPGMGGQGMGQDMGVQGMGGQMGPQGMGGQGMNPQGMGGPGMGGQGMGGQGMGGQNMGGQNMGGQNMGGQGIGGQGMGGGQAMGGQSMGGQNGALSGGVAISSGGPSQPQGRATPDQSRSNMPNEGFNGNPQAQGMEFAGQKQDMGQPNYPATEGNTSTPQQGTTPTRTITPQFRGRPMQQNVTMRGRGSTYAMRGGRVPIRSTSPLPPNVPTGPRNKNKYKDIDGSAPAVDGLDYGGGKERSTPPDHDEGRSSRSVLATYHIHTFRSELTQISQETERLSRERRE